MQGTIGFRSSCPEYVEQRPCWVWKPPKNCGKHGKNGKCIHLPLIKEQPSFVSDQDNNSRCLWGSTEMFRRTKCTSIKCKCVRQSTTTSIPISATAKISAYNPCSGYMWKLDTQPSTRGKQQQAHEEFFVDLAHYHHVKCLLQNMSRRRSPVQ